MIFAHVHVLDDPMPVLMVFHLDILVSKQKYIIYIYSTIFKLAFFFHL